MPALAALPPTPDPASASFGLQAAPAAVSARSKPAWSPASSKRPLVHSLDFMITSFVIAVSAYVLLGPILPCTARDYKANAPMPIRSSRPDPKEEQVPTAYREPFFDPEHPPPSRTAAHGRAVLDELRLRFLKNTPSQAGIEHPGKVWGVVIDASFLEGR